MFDKQRYLTCGINAKIPIGIQLVMWAIIDIRKSNGAELYYLQTFQLSPHGKKQEIVYSQERPAYANKIIVRLKCSPVKAHVWVMDSGEYSTMLLPEEY